MASTVHTERNEAPHKRSPRSLRTMVLLIVGLILGIFVIVFFFIVRATMSEMLLQSESSYLTEQLGVVRGVFDAAKENTVAMAMDTAFWDESVHFVQGENPDYIQRNWPGGDMLQRYRFNFIVIKDRQGRDAHVAFRDYQRDEAIPVPEGFTDFLTGISDAVLREYDELTGITGAGITGSDTSEIGDEGIVFYQGVPYYQCTMPIVLPDEDAPPSGTVTYGSVLNNEYFQHLTYIDSISFQISNTLEAGGNALVYEAVNDDVFSMSMPLQDKDDGFISLTMSVRRSIYEQGRGAIDLATFLLAATAAIFIILLYAVIVRRVLKPIERLSGDLGGGAVLQVDPERYSSAREITTLCTAINEMAEGLDRSKISLGAFQSILNGMDAYLYATDPKTDEILFMNDKMARHYGIDGSAVGLICWKVLQTGLTERCSFCPNHQLERDPDAVVHWEEHSPLTGRYYQNTDCLIDWTGLKHAHLQHSVDITEIKAAQKALKRRLKQQELMSAMAQGFISIEDMPTLIGEALRMTGEFLSAGKIVIAALDHETQALTYRYGWRNPDGRAQPLVKRSFSFGSGDVHYDAFIAERLPYLTCSDIEGKEEYAYLSQMGVRSFLTVPVYASDAFWGTITIDDCEEPRVWSESDIQLMRMIGSVISGVITRSETEEDLIRMSSIVDSSPNYITYIDDDGRFEYINQGAVDITGYSAEEMRSGGLGLIFDDETYAKILEEIIPRVREEGKQDYELPIRRKDGQDRILAISVFTAGHNTGGQGAIATDITEKRALERDIIAAKEQAERSNLAKSEFLSRMSHEMRTPMNAIIGMTSIALGTQDAEKKDYCLGKVSEASSHLLGVINDILDMSKIEANKLELTSAAFHFERMLIRVSNIVNFRIDEKRQKFSIKVGRDVPPYIVADEQRLSQVITNLVSNAVKFTPEEGSIALLVQKVDEQDGLCTLRIQVSDSGIGISQERQERLFTSFEQADGSISRRFGGTGLGLAISKRIVELMEGAIWVESELGQGSRFIFTFKAGRGQDDQRSLLDQRVRWDNLRILIVDDDPDVREVFMSIAQSLDISCAAASDGEEACRLFDQAAFDIVFVDWRMPGMNGIELTRRIKDRFGESSVVIMISAAQWSDIEPEAKAAGVSRFMPKPLFASLIVDSINEGLGAGCQPLGHEREARDAGAFEGKHILLAEDIEINREILIAILEDTGVAIDCAENGRIAVDLFSQDPDRYDMIFMDIHMPEEDGYQATRRIRALPHPRSRSVPIVAMTANVFREDIERCLAAGMDDHVGKPLDVDEVLGKMAKFMRLESLGD